MFQKIIFFFVFLSLANIGFAQDAREATRNDLNEKWFTKNYKNYNLDEAKLKSCKNELKDFSVLIFMGTWCSDSREHVPPFYKIADSTDLKISKLILVEEKNDDKPYNKEYNIERVPTFILLDETGNEKGRIVEMPKVSLEVDLCEIVKK